MDFKEAPVWIKQPGKPQQEVKGLGEQELEGLTAC